MAVLWQAVGSLSGAVNAGAAPSMPAHQAGDIIFIVVESANENIGAITPTGYTSVATPLGTGTAGGVSATRATAWWKKATSASETTPSLGDYGDHTIAVIFTVRGADQASPINITATSVDSTATTSGSCPAVTTTVTGALIVNIMTNTIDAATAVIPGAVTNANLTGLTKRFDAGSTSGNGGGIAIISGSLATASSSGSTTFTTTSSLHSYMTIAIAPDSVAPTITSSNTFSVVENTAFSTTLTANEPVTWARAGGSDTFRFSLTGSTLSMTAKDFEAPTDDDLDNIYTVLLSATDLGGNISYQTVSVTVTDSTTTPTWTSSTGVAVFENDVLNYGCIATGATGYSIVGGDDAAHFELSGNTLRWVGNGTKDFENPGDANADNNYLVTVRATGTEGFTDLNISANVQNQIVNPTWVTAAAQTIAENTTLALTLNATNAVAYAITGGNDQADFEIVSGVLRFVRNETKNFETPTDTGNNNTYSVIVTASSANDEGTSSRTFTVTITDTDEIAPTITSASSISVAESAVLSMALTANETVTWSLVGGADQARFELNASTLRWLSNGVKDFEAPNDADTNNVYVVTVRATDLVGLTTDQTISVTVTNVDDTAPTITSTNTKIVAENVTLAHLLTASETVTWSIVGGEDQARFEINGSTLRWLGDGVKDFEIPDDANTDNAYVVTVRATDGVALTADQTITVTVTDVVETGDIVAPVVVRTSYRVLPRKGLSITLSADEAVTWTKTGGTNEADFSLAGDTLTLGALQPRQSKSVQVTATDASNNATVATITVTAIKSRRGSGSL